MSVAAAISVEVSVSGQGENVHQVWLGTLDDIQHLQVVMDGFLRVIIWKQREELMTMACPYLGEGSSTELGGH